MGEIVTVDGKPRFENVRFILQREDYPVPVHGFETRNFVPPDDRLVTIFGYLMRGTSNTDTFPHDSETGEVTPISKSPDANDEAVGSFPDGTATLVEHAPSQGRDGPLIDLFRLPPDRSGELERITWFSDYKGAKGSRGVISDDGRHSRFQLGKEDDEAGRGHGVFLYEAFAKKTWRP